MLCAFEFTIFALEIQRKMRARKNILWISLNCHKTNETVQNRSVAFWLMGISSMWTFLLINIFTWHYQHVRKKRISTSTCVEICNLHRYSTPAANDMYDNLILFDFSIFPFTSDMQKMYFAMTRHGVMQYAHHTHFCIRHVIHIFTICQWKNV